MGDSIDVRDYIKKLSKEELQIFKEEIMVKNSFYHVLQSEGTPSDKDAESLERDLIEKGIPKASIGTASQVYRACKELNIQINKILV